MRNALCLSPPWRAANRGVTLVELVVFIVIVSVALVALLNVFGYQVRQSVDPVARVRALEKGQALLDEILSRKFDENTPTGGVPACGSASPGAPACLGINPESDLDDVGDYHGYQQDSASKYPVTVSVTNAGGDLGIDPSQARLITVTVGMPDNASLNLSAYRVNF